MVQNETLGKSNNMRGSDSMFWLNTDFERTETQQIRLTLEPADIRKYEKRLNEVFEEYEFSTFDTHLNIDFKIHHGYRNLVSRIELMLEMLREKDHRLIQIDIKELEHGKCLIHDLYLLFDELEKGLKNK